MTLGAAELSELLLVTAEAGGTAAAVTVVAAPDSRQCGRRLVRVRKAGI